MKNLILHELQQFSYGLRLPITLAVVMVMFAVSSLTYTGEYSDMVKGYNELTAAQEQQLRDKTGNVSNVAVGRRDYWLPPRNNGLSPTAAN